MTIYSALRRFLAASLDAKVAARPYWLEPNPLPVVCAWCGTPMSEGEGPVSHGICPGCIEKFEADVEPKACAA